MIEYQVDRPFSHQFSNLNPQTGQSYFSKRRPLFRIFCLFKNQNDSNPRPSEHESPPITTRLGLKVIFHFVHQILGSSPTLSARSILGSFARPPAASSRPANASATTRLSSQPLTCRKKAATSCLKRPVRWLLCFCLRTRHRRSNIFWQFSSRLSCLGS